MKVVPVNPSDPRPDRLEGARVALEAGRIVALPTETFYGLAADALNPEAARSVNRLKGKAPDAPVLLMLADRDQVTAVAEGLPEVFSVLAETFWPGPLTLVVPAAGHVPLEVTGGRGSVAVRVPGLALPRLLAAALGRPITGVSANLTGEPPCRNAAEVARCFEEGVAMVLDGGPTAGGAPSTILDLTGPRPKVLRRGLLPVTSLRPFVRDL